MIKTRVGPQVKGEVYIKIKNRTFKKGSFVSFTEDEFRDSFVQTMIEKGFLLIEDSDLNDNVNKNDFVKIVSCKKNPFVIPSLKRAINPKEEICIDRNLLEDSFVQQAINGGYIKVLEIVVLENKNIEEDVNKVKQEALKARENDIETKTNDTQKEEEKSKRIKRVKDKIQEEDKDTENKEKIKAYIHKPDGARINYPPSNLEDESLDDIFVDSFNNKEEISFVDIEQNKQKETDLRRRLAKNNEEIQ